MTALATDYMGLRLRNPLVASPSPLSYTYDGMRRLADGGVGAIVMYSLFEEQVREQQAHVAKLVDGPAESFPEALDYVPSVAKEDAATHAYLSLLERAAATLDVPVIASLNGTTPEGWTIFARDMQDAGAAALRSSARRSAARRPALTRHAVHAGRCSRIGRRRPRAARRSWRRSPGERRRAAQWAARNTERGGV